MKINYRESKSCFYGFSGIKAPLANHQSPPYCPHSAAFHGEKRYYCKVILEVLGGNSGAMTP